MPHMRSPEDWIIALCAGGGAHEKHCPLDISRTIAARRQLTGNAWHEIVPGVRRAALRLAHSGHLTIFANGAVVHPDAVRGGFRLALARSD